MTTTMRALDGINIDDDQLALGVDGGTFGGNDGVTDHGHDVPPSRCQADDCLNPTVPYSGRGRKPRFCEEHKGNRGSSADGKPRSKRPTNLETGLHQSFLMMAMSLGAVSLVTSDKVFVDDAAIIRDNAESMAKAWSEYAARNPKVRKILEGMMQSTGVMGIVVATAPVAFGISTNHIAANAAKKAAAAAAREAAATHTPSSTVPTAI